MPCSITARATASRKGRITRLPRASRYPAAQRWSQRSGCCTWSKRVSCPRPADPDRCHNAPPARRGRDRPGAGKSLHQTRSSRCALAVVPSVAGPVSPSLRLRCIFRPCSRRCGLSTGGMIMGTTLARTILIGGLVWVAGTANAQQQKAPVPGPPSGAAIAVAPPQDGQPAAWVTNGGLVFYCIRRPPENPDDPKQNPAGRVSCSGGPIGQP